VRSTFETRKTYLNVDANAFLYNFISDINTETLSKIKSFLFLVDKYIKSIIDNLKSEIISKSMCETSLILNKNKFISFFKEKISQIPEITKFFYIGEKCIQISADTSENNYFEVYCRCEKEQELEFMLNDVTRSKFFQKQKSEVKYKTLFLSKVAHEFKNPLMCINELINQVDSLDIFNSDKHEILKIPLLYEQSNHLKKIKKNLNKIKSMSNFLITLVKDLDYFSQSLVDPSSIKIEKSNSNLESILEFCEEIALSLIKKYNKSSSVRFIIEKSEKAPKFIFTDEWRLKQVLINLISNSIKFTLYGEVILSISIEENKIKLQVKDSGPGIKEDRQKSLFQPFSKGTNENNELGSGLGLTIVSELTKKLGDSIQYKTGPKGTTFWFFLPLSEENFINENEFVNEILSKDLNKEIIRHGKTQFVEKSENEFNYNLEKLINVENTNKTLDIRSDKINLPIICFDQNSKESNSNSLNLSHSLIKESYEKSLFHTESHPLKENEFSFKNFKISDILPILKNSAYLNIIIVDDEKISRLSTLRILKYSAKELKLKINYVEADDGIECLYYFYKLISQGVNISAIISDQNMNYLNGITSSEIIYKIIIEKNLAKVPFYLLTAIDNKEFKNKSVDQVISKPLLKQEASNMFKKFLQ
jgi:signal transduction histidine kinase/CheY-like chemotaxis protein